MRRNIDNDYEQERGAGRRAGEHSVVVYRRRNFLGNTVQRRAVVEDRLPGGRLDLGIDGVIDESQVVAIVGWWTPGGVEGAGRR